MNSLINNLFKNEVPRPKIILVSSIIMIIGALIHVGMATYYGPNKYILMLLDFNKLPFNLQLNRVLTYLISFVFPICLIIVNLAVIQMRKWGAVLQLVYAVSMLGVYFYIDGFTHNQINNNYVLIYLAAISTYYFKRMT